MAVSSSGLPLGVLKAQCLAPEPKAPEDKRRAFAIPIEEKKTFVWIEHHRDMVAVASQMPHTRLILNPAVEPVEMARDARVYWASQLLRTSPSG